MAMYSLSCACYSLIIEKLIKRFKAKPVYIGGLLFYSSGMTLMAVTKHPIGVILFSWTAGVMYSTLFTMPYLLVAHYHDKGVVSLRIIANCLNRNLKMFFKIYLEATYVVYSLYSVFSRIVILL